ncbi:PKD domain-containing protein [Streptomyces sp. ISL-43]|uniref:PKD domain-containing protein n=1 Tax=Streptomyces sp. ISL-43 TaxID=2819183 RepID=UPI001BEAE9B0|nr:PKD domain-containing protein [Streptomyces sp. ISL-43]MBT2445623.1 PKD domain-containing protein [Streptomyces sp. ISL-43]
MRPTRAAASLTAGLVALLGMPAAAVAADTPTDLYVNSGVDSHCSDSGTGSQAVPFCSIAAAAKVVLPGQTVRIEADTTYSDAVTVDRSGEPGKPITFAAASEGEYDHRAFMPKSLTISGASHMVFRGLTVLGGVRVENSHDVTLENLHGGDSADPVSLGLAVGKESTDVRARWSSFDGIQVDGGAQRTVLSRNRVHSRKQSVVTVVDAPGTVITNNTLTSTCAAAVSVSGTSTGSALVNNVLYIAGGDPQCKSAEQRTGITVAPNATAGTRADYNLIAGKPAAGLVPYSWSGTGYQTVAAFAAASGQGAHDILTPTVDGVGPVAGSPTIDSGDATAQGAFPLDRFGSPAADDPNVANTGKDGGYIDRGAAEVHDVMRGLKLSVSEKWAPVGTSVKATAAVDNKWPTTVTYHFDFGDGTAPVVTKATSAEHVYSSPGDYVVKVRAVNESGVELSETWAIKATPAGPLTAALTAQRDLPTSDSPIGREAPLSVTVDTRGSATPWPVTSVDVDFGDGATDHSGNLTDFEHAYDKPGDYKVTLTLQDSKGAKSTATRNVKVDYAPSGYVATEPFRLMDTRTNNTTVRGGYPVPVTLPAGLAVPDHVLSASMASAVLNVTVTGASEDTHLTVWPSGQPRPATSNVNVRAGGTSSNTVTVPVGADGKIQAQLNSGWASLIVDFVGYYQPNIGQRFSPLAPTRVADTRTAGGALGGGKTRTVKVAGVNGIPADATAVALNLTGTGATEQAHVIAYPDPAKRPSTSNLNVEPGKDKSNQAIVPVGPNGTITLYTNSGSTHLVLDAVGYYGKDGKALFTPVVPNRLADTRTTRKVAAGATTTVSGLPSNAVGAVLNVTATDSTGPGFLTAYGYGGTLPGASSLNTLPGVTVPNHVTTPVASGKVSIFNSYGGGNHVITDLLGYFTVS